MEAVLPGVRTWTAVHPNLGAEVRSYWVPASSALIDPLLENGTDIPSFEGQPPNRVLLTNRHHLRSSERLAAELGCSIHCHRAGLHEFDAGLEVQGFDFGEEVAPGIEALEVDAICAEETALLISDAKALSLADAVVGYDGRLGFVPDRYLGDDPEGVKRSVRSALAHLLHREFDHLLFAHGDPLIGGGREALREFCG